LRHAAQSWKNFRLPGALPKNPQQTMRLQTRPQQRQGLCCNHALFLSPYDMHRHIPRPSQARHDPAPHHCVILANTAGEGDTVQAAHRRDHDAEVRGRIVAGLAWAGAVPVHIVPAEEERSIAAEALALLRAGT